MNIPVWVSSTAVAKALLISVAVSGFFSPLQSTAQGGSSCSAIDESACEVKPYCVGVNAGFFNPGSLARPFIDQMKSAAIEVRGFQPIDILRNADVALDENKYPTEIDTKIFVRFFLNIKQTYAVEQMPAGKYVVMWDGVAGRPNVQGENVSDVTFGRNRIEFQLNPRLFGGAWFSYKNLADQQHVTNIRIVPEQYEADYADWSWNQYEIGAQSNPPIFFPQWLEKMSSGCAIRYVNSNGTNDFNVVEFGRDSSSTRINPSNSVWYEGFGLGQRAHERHQWPWELMVEASLQTETTPWLNFRVLTYENLINGDSFVADISRLFHEHYGKEIYVEYGNEIWNFGYPFFVSTNHVFNNGPGTNNNLEENYSLRNNAIQEAFAEAYGDDGCLVKGVVASQGRNYYRGKEALRHADKRYVDVISPGLYVGDDIWPESPAWPFVAGLWSQVEAGQLTRAAAFRELRREILTGSSEVITRNWRNDIRVFADQYVELARDNNLCLAVYEMGLHMRVDGVDPENAEHVGVRDFVHAYKRSSQQTAVEVEMHEWLKEKGATPALVYASFMKDGAHAFSYWDSTFEPIERQSGQAALIRYYRDAAGPVLSRLNVVGARLKNLPVNKFRSAKLKDRLIDKYELLRTAVDAGRKRDAVRLARQINRRIDGCGAQPDGDDYLTSCAQQRRMQQSMTRVIEAIRESL